MQLFHHIHTLRERLKAERSNGKRIGFVPTMGNLHAGHLALVKQAQTTCDCVVTSIFVNPLQFGLNEDWDKYPRTLEADAAKLRDIGCDILFCPEDTEMYPNGMAEQTRVIVPSMTDVLCGASRPGHFEGVTTVVSKLFNIVQPDEAVFGIKDFQQLAVIRRMVEDLCMPVQVTAGDIVRESDGLAMSSRNQYLTADEREKVTCLHCTLEWVSSQLKEGRRDFFALEADAKEKIEISGFTVDYFVVCNSKTLAPAADDDDCLTILGAMYTQSARLIDNVSVVLEGSTI